MASASVVHDLFRSWFLNCPKQMQTLLTNSVDNQSLILHQTLFAPYLTQISLESKYLVTSSNSRNSIDQIKQALSFGIQSKERVITTL